MTDINNTSALCDFFRACQKEEIKPAWGIEFRSTEHELLWIGIAKNNAGVLELNKFLTHHSMEKKLLPSKAPEFADVFVIYPFCNQVPEGLRPYEYVGIRASELNKLYDSDWKNHMLKLVAFHPVTFLNTKGFHTHKLLRAIDQNTLLSKIDDRSLAHASEVMISEAELAEKFKMYPELILHAEQLLDQCIIDLDLDKPKNKKTFTLTRHDDKLLLEKLAWDGFEYRYGKSNKIAFDRVVKELAIIDAQDFMAYFLITHDIIQYATSRGFHHVGRGSGANSIVAYCLKLTDVDPIELDLYFERFINPYRASPPDFDIDFSWDERDDITDYVFKRYGKEHVALLATYATFQGRAILREIGKVYGLPKADIDMLVDEPKSTHKHHPLAKEIHYYGQRLIDFPNHLSIHAGGILITEESICQYTALELMPKGFPVSHFDMHVAEDNGFYKYDILSQRGLGHIKESVQHIKKNKQISIDVHRVSDFKKDPKINEKLQNAKTIGCFYIESPAMRGLISKLKCDNYLTLVQRDPGRTGGRLQLPLQHRVDARLAEAAPAGGARCARPRI